MLTNLLPQLSINSFSTYFTYTQTTPIFLTVWLHVNVPPALLTSEAGTLIIHCVLLASGKWQFHADPLSLIARTAHATVKVAVKFNKTHTYADVHMYVSVYICIHIYYRKICLNLFFLETLQTSQSRTNFDVFPFACRAKVFHFFCFCTFHKLHYWKIYEVARQ